MREKVLVLYTCLAILIKDQSTKHVEMDIHFVHEKVALGQIRVLHVPTRYQFADIFTNSLLQELFLDF